MINKTLWGLLYLIACSIFFNTLEYALIPNILISIGIAALLIYVVYGSNKPTDHSADSLNYYAALFSINIMGPLISSAEDLSLERPFLILGFYYELYLVVQYCRREGFKLLAIIPSVILSSILFCLAQKWIYIPFTYISALLSWWNYSNKRKS